MLKSVREKGKLSIRRFCQTFQGGDKVVLDAEPSYQRGMYFLRFHGRIGEVKKQRGKVYEVSVRDKNKMKTVLVHPIHLKKV